MLQIVYVTRHLLPANSTKLADSDISLNVHKYCGTPNTKVETLNTSPRGVAGSGQICLTFDIIGTFPIQR